MYCTPLIFYAKNVGKNICYEICVNITLDTATHSKLPQKFPPVNKIYSLLIVDTTDMAEVRNLVQNV